MKEILETLNIPVTDENMQQLSRYYEHLIKYNEIMNLTAITEQNEVYIKHFYDSLTLAKIVDLNHISTMLDIGSGAGFPGIVIKIFYPHIKLTIVDSLQKRIAYLTQLVESLHLTGVTLVHDRAEIYVKSHRNAFQLVTARAVASLEILDELALPYVTVGGSWVIMKSQSLEKELEKAGKGIHILGGVVKEKVHLELPLNFGERNLVRIQKVKENNLYPRAFKDIKNKPL